MWDCPTLGGTGAQPGGSEHLPCLGPTRASVRSSCRPFALNDLDDYEKHFTVMNYDPELVLKQVGRGLAGPGEGLPWRLAQTGPDDTHQLVFRAACVVVRGAAFWYLRPLPQLPPQL